MRLGCKTRRRASQESSWDKTQTTEVHAVCPEGGAKEGEGVTAEGRRCGDTSRRGNVVLNCGHHHVEEWKTFDSIHEKDRQENL